MSEYFPHIALLPSAGMGHLTPFLRLAAMLVNNHCKVTLITPTPTVSLAESKFISRFLSAVPQVNHTEFHLMPFDASAANSTDPFFLQFEAIRRSAHLLPSLLDFISPPLSALVYDVSLISPVLAAIESMFLPRYILFTPSAKMFSIFSYFPTAVASKQITGDGEIEIPGIIPRIPGSSIPPLLFDLNSLFAKIFMEDSPKLKRLDGVLLNTFEDLEGKTLEAINEGNVVKGLPHAFAIGPLIPLQFEKGDQSQSALNWLDDQREGSVVYVCFGSRNAMKRDQIREIGKGLMRSGCKFLWVVKDKLVDRDENDSLDEVLGYKLAESMKEKGLVVKTWVCQVEILGHKGVGGFLSHCGWNSVTEAAWQGVPILAWPLAGDQKVNAELVEKSGWGMWMRNWGWLGEKLVDEEEIGKAIKDMMGSRMLKVNAVKIREAARNSNAINLEKLIQDWKKHNG
uniref:Glycosyltransferase n=1 Tax=Polygala tenuifolia TaxID=355332 RepID=A0A3G3NBP2_9FABA|nr:UDP-glucosyltransferase UGT708L1 [Polygala tenuifolia]